MDNGKFIALAKKVVCDYENGVSIKERGEVVSLCDIYVVWSCKTLQNNKALLSTPIKDGRYYEVTYNGDKKELYLDCYKKEENACFSGVE